MPERMGAIQRRLLQIKRLQCQAKAALLPAAAGWQYIQLALPVSSLLALCQVRALSILMDLVRVERHGEFAAATFAPVLEALLRARKAAPEALAAFVSKYLGYADVQCALPLLHPATPTLRSVSLFVAETCLKRPVCFSCCGTSCASLVGHSIAGDGHRHSFIRPTGCGASAGTTH